MANWFDTADKAGGLRECVQSILVGLEDEDVLATLRAISRTNWLLVDVGAEVVEIAADTTKLSQRSLAEALGVSPRTFSGLRR